MVDRTERNAEANYRVLFVKFAEITRRYASAAPEERRRIGEELERVASGRSLSSNDAALRNPEIEETVRANYSTVIKSFLGKEARSFREQLGLSRKSVAEQCGIHPQVIGQYEGCPELPRRATENVVKYLAWLRSNGFNLNGAM